MTSYKKFPRPSRRKTSASHRLAADEVYFEDTRLDRAAMRIAAVMGGPGLPALPSYRALQHDEGDRMNPFQGTAAESDGDYFLRRFEAEMRAADEATVPQARKAHQELAERYAQLVAATRLSAERGRIATAGLFSQRKPIGIWTRTPRLRAALRDDVRQLASV